MSSKSSMELAELTEMLTAHVEHLAATAAAESRKALNSHRTPDIKSVRAAYTAMEQASKLLKKSWTNYFESLEK